MKTLREQLNGLDAEWSKTKEEYGRPDGMFDIGEIYYFSCNFEEIAKQMDALLEECYHALQCPIKSQVMAELLKNNGYGNDTDR